MKFKVVYTKDKTKIQNAINNGIIDSGDMIIVDNGDGNGELTFVNEDNRQINIGGGNSGSGGPTDVVRYGASQSLSKEQKDQARNNIGAGTSNFSGNYDDLIDKPSIPTEESLKAYIDEQIGVIENGSY